jgi:hypothetical protein
MRVERQLRWVESFTADATFSVAQSAGFASPSHPVRFFAGIIVGRQIGNYRDVAFPFAIRTQLRRSSFVHAALSWGKRGTS